MEDLKIIIKYNNQKISIFPQGNVEKILKEIKKLIPEYYKYNSDKIKEIYIKMLSNRKLT